MFPFNLSLQAVTQERPVVGKEPYDKAVTILRKEYLETLPEDIAKARRLLEEASEAGYLEATRVLADLLFVRVYCVLICVAGKEWQAGF